MTRFYRLTLFSALLFSPVFSAAYAQQEESGLLYFPPELVVEVIPESPWHGTTFDSEEEPVAETDRQTAQSLSLSRTTNLKTSPLLPIIFFEPGQSYPPGRYHLFSSSMETDEYTDTTGWEAWSDIDMYHEALNIIGFRMRELPRTTIELEGGYSTESGESPEAADDRVEVIKEYLVNIWKIEPDRIALLPPRRMCDSADNIFLQEEAQCVLIHPSAFELVRPVRYGGASYVISSPEFMIVLQPNTRTPADVAAVEIILRTGDQIISRTEVRGSADSGLYRLHGSWMTYGGYFEESGSLEVHALVYQLDGTTRTSNSVRIPVSIAADTSFSDRGYSEYNGITLPFFFPGQSKLSPLQILLLDEQVDEHMRRRAANYVRDSETHELFVRAHREAGEYPSEDNGLLFSRRAEYESREDQIRGIYASSSWETPMFLYEQENQETPDIMARIYGYQEEALTNARRDQDELSSMTFDESMRREIYSVLAGREKEVAEHLMTHYTGTGRFDTARVSIEDYSHESIYSEENDGLTAQCHYTPEERFYGRAVRIVVSSTSPSRYEYHDGEYGNDDYDEGESDDGEYEDDNADDYPDAENPAEEYEDDDESR